MKNTQNKNGLARLALSALMVATLAACGGGGGGGWFASAPATASSPSTPDTTTATGVAATGAPISGATVELKCASGATAAAITDADGVWTASLKSTDYPCVARVPSVQDNNVYASLHANMLPSTTTIWLHSLVSAPGTTNITPLTDLIVGIVGGQSPSTWYAGATNGTLSGAITPSALSNALNKLKITLASLPGKLSLLDGFDPITSPFSAKAGNAIDDFLETYAAALKASGLTQEQAATRASAEESLTQEAYAATGFTTPNLSSFRIAAARTLEDYFAVAIPDPLRGTLWATAELDSNGSILAVRTGPFSAVVSQDGNRAVELCTMNAGVQLSQYVFVSEDLVPVTDPTELQGQYFTEYENCAETGTSQFLQDGSFEFRPTGGSPDPADMDIAQAFTEAGREKQASNGISVMRAKAYKYTYQGITKYVYIMVSTRKDSTSPELNGDTDYVLMGVSHLPS